MSQDKHTEGTDLPSEHSDASTGSLRGVRGSQAGDEQYDGSVASILAGGDFVAGLTDIGKLLKKTREDNHYTMAMSDCERAIYDLIRDYAERLATEARIDEHSVIDGLGGFNTDKLPVLEQRVKELSATLTGKAE